MTGRYVLSGKVCDLLRHTTQGADGEIQLTDALHHLLLIEKIEAYHLQGKSHGFGSKIGYPKAGQERECSYFVRPEISHQNFLKIVFV